jgi:hypothetical protein
VRLRGSPADAWELGFHLAGIVGVEPWGFTLRELVWLAEGRQHENWTHTASLMSLWAQIHHSDDSGEPAPTMYTFHPFYKVPKPKPLEATPDILMAFGFRPVSTEVPDGG